MTLSDPSNLLYLLITLATIVPVVWAGAHLGRSYQKVRARFTLILGLALAALLAYGISEVVTLMTHQSYTLTTGDLGRSVVVLIQGWSLFYVISR